MKNSQNDLNLITQTFEEEGCYDNPRAAAVASVAFLDNFYVVIPRSALPKIGFGSLDDAFAGNTKAKLENMSENVHDGNTEKMRNLAYQYLVMADYVDGKVKRVEESNLTKLRVEAWLTLHPKSGITAADMTAADYDQLTRNDKAAVDAVVALKRELAELKKKR